MLCDTHILTLILAGRYVRSGLHCCEW